MLPGHGAAYGQTGDNPLVEQALQDTDRAQQAYEELTEQLDQLASQYEGATAHSHRLQEELEGADVALLDAQQQIDAAQAARNAQIRQAYKEPALALVRQSGPFLVASDIGTALHVSRMLEMVTSARVEVQQRTAVVAQNTAANVANQQGILNGTDAAMEDLRTLSTVFSDALQDAAADVVRAEAALADAEDAAAAAAAAQVGQGTGQVGSILAGPLGLLPPPPMRQATIPGGTQIMACPIGAPNGFIDSWGFPRSGGRQHKGVDMFAAHGMPLYAAAEGVVTRVYNNRLGGLSIDLVDRLGNRYYYAHLSAAYVVGGQAVAAGELLAANGNSGNAIGTPPHLHWQFHPHGGGPTNPYPLAAALCR